MNEAELQELLEDKKLLNLLRLLHQLLHLYDEKQARMKDKTNEQAGLGDTINIVLKDKDGNVKQTLNNEKEVKK